MANCIFFFWARFDFAFYTTYWVAVSGRYTWICSAALGTEVCSFIHLDSPLQKLGLQENFFCLPFHDWQEAQGISSWCSMAIMQLLFQAYLPFMKRNSWVTICIQNPQKSLFALRVKEEMAPRPGFGPGSCGRQPHILDRTILPGH